MGQICYADSKPVTAKKKFYDIGLKARGSRHFTLRPPGLLQLKDLQGHSGV